MMNPFDQLILIVDDHDENLLIASEILRSEGYQTAMMHSGEEALDFCQHLRKNGRSMPDLILTDIMMPIMDGFTLCKHFKKKTETQHIPVIFITAISDVRSMTKGFEAGGVDYITKPFHAQEMCSRVSVHLSLKNTRDELAQSNERLRELNEEKNNLLSIAAHDLKNPIASIMTASVIIKKHFTKMSADAILNNVSAIFDTARRMTDIIGNLLDINKIESGEVMPRIERVDANRTLGEVIVEYQERADAKSIELEVVRPSSPQMIEADTVMLRQVLDNLISNALKFSPTGEAVSVTLTQVNNEAHKMCVNIVITNQSSFISEEEKQKLFCKFGRLSNRPTGGESSTGLGLFIVKRLVEGMRGIVWCETNDILVNDKKETMLQFIVQFPIVLPP
jgi:two-component system, sensor histidine kinase and response regulator